MSSTSATSPEVIFRPERTHLFAAAIMAVIGILATGSAPAPWRWILMGLFLLAVALFCWWAIKTRTVVQESGISAHYAFRGSQTTPWKKVKGIAFKSSKAYLHCTDNSDVLLPALSFNDLPALEKASKGRIPDALSQGRNAAEEKVRVVYRDGYEVLMTKEEFEEHEARRSRRTQQP